MENAIPILITDNNCLREKSSESIFLMTLILILSMDIENSLKV